MEKHFINVYLKHVKAKTEEDTMKRITLKESFTLVLPLLILCAFIVPYDWFLHHYTVNGRLFGIYVNSVTGMFWQIMAICVTVLSAFTSHKLFEGKRWLNVAYVASILLLSVLLASRICQHMMCCCVILPL